MEIQPVVRESFVYDVNYSICFLLLDLQKCRSETGITRDGQATVLWSTSQHLIVSQHYPNVFESKPLCLDEHKFPLRRTCNGTKWVPETTPICAFVQEPYEPYETCMPGYFKSPPQISTDLCFRLESAGTWNTTCPAGYTTLFYDLSTEAKQWVLSMIKSRRINSVWMPGRRIEKNGPVLWTVPGERYGENVARLVNKYYHHENIYKSDCFVAHASDGFMAIDLDDCNKEYPMLCMYDERDALTQLACPDGFMTTSFKGRQHACYSGHRVLTGSISTPDPPTTRNMDNVTLFPSLSTPKYSDESSEPISSSRRRRGTKPTTTDAEVYYRNTNRNLFGRDESHNLLNDECGGEIFVMTTPEKTTIARWLAKELRFTKHEHCLFALASNGIYIKDREEWMAVSSEVRFVNWDYPIEFGEYLTTNLDGRWNWVERSFNCMLCQRGIEMERPKMFLQFDEFRHRLFLTVYSEKYLWRLKAKESGATCFTNSDYELVRTVKMNKVWTDELSTDEVFLSDGPTSISKTIYELRLYGDGPGYYWCQGYALPNFTLIEAQKIVAHRRSRGTVLAGLVKVKCHGMECTMVFVEDYLKDLARFYRTHLQKFQRSTVVRDDKYHISIDNVRAMHIEEIQPSTSGAARAVGRATVLFHITVDKVNLDESENIGNLPWPVFKVWKMREVLGRIMSESSSPDYQFIALKSTEYCLPEYVNGSNGLKWSAARIGETIAPQQLCLCNSGLPVLRACVGDFLFGGEWKNLTQQTCHINALSDITQNLYEIDKGFSQPNETSAIVRDINGLLTNSTQKDIVPADLFYLARVMSTVFRLNNHRNITTLNKIESENIFSIYNSIMGLNENTTRIAAALNSTNILLNAFDNIINGIPMNITSEIQVRNNVIVNAEDGTIVTETPKLIVYVIDPSVRSVSGIALLRKTDKMQLNDDFSDYNVRLLYANQSTASLLAEEHLEAAAFAPQDLLDRLDETRFAKSEEMLPDEAPAVRIVVTVYYNDVLFQEYTNVTYAKSGGKIISVSIPGYGPNLPGLLPIFVRASNYSSENFSACGYWSFGTFSGWQGDGCEYGGSAGVENPVILCACSHLTHFAYLVLGTYVYTMNSDNEVVTKEIHQEALDLITLLGCSLSLVGILGIAITAIAFKSWRQKPSSKVLLQLSAAVGLQMILLLFVNTEYSAVNLISEERWLICVGLGALLQYSILVAFSWMLITAYLQFMRYVKVLGQTRVSRFFLKSFLIGWCIPLIPVLLVVCISPAAYVHHVESQNGGICYPSGMAFYLGIILPVGLIVMSNLIIFLMVIYNILTGPGGKLRATERDLTLAQLRLSVFLFFLLGLSWIFGFLATTKAGLVFSYLFCLTATIQGFVLFIYFIILDPGTRKLWRNFFGKYICCTNKSTDCK